MAVRTYTVLVTVTDDPENLPLIDRIEKQIQQGLEEGTREHSGFSSAMVHAVQGDRVERKPVTMSRMNRAKEFHAELVAEDGK